MLATWLIQPHRQQQQGHQGTARRLHQAYGIAALDELSRLHIHPEEWILMHRQGRAVRSPLAARNRVEAHTRGAHVSNCGAIRCHRPQQVDTGHRL